MAIPNVLRDQTNANSLRGMRVVIAPTRRSRVPARIFAFAVAAGVAVAWALLAQNQ